MRVEGIDRLDQTDRADGNKVILRAVVLIILFDDVRDESQIVFDKNIPRLFIPFRRKLQIMLFLRLFQRLRKALGMRDMQDKQEKILTDIR